jgi:hypothetical protein
VLRPYRPDERRAIRQGLIAVFCFLATIMLASGAAGWLIRDMMGPSL